MFLKTIDQNKNSNNFAVQLLIVAYILIEHQVQIMKNKMKNVMFGDA